MTKSERALRKDMVTDRSGKGLARRRKARRRSRSLGETLGKGNVQGEVRSKVRCDVGGIAGRPKLVIKTREESKHGEVERERREERKGGSTRTGWRGGVETGGVK
eukprot:2784796-Pleurochrysis_carterae.AAC.1